MGVTTDGLRIVGGLELRHTPCEKDAQRETIATALHTVAAVTTADNS